MSRVTQEMLQAACAAFRMDRPPIDAMHDALSAAMKAQASAAPEKEPVAWMDARSPGLHATISNEVKRHNTRLGGAPTASVTGYSIPLYTHADDGEVERLRAELVESRRNEHNSEVAYRAAIERQEELRAELVERDNACQQLAEAQALLRKALTAIRFVGIQDHLVDYALTGNIQAEVEQYLYAISATAQPAEVKS